MISKARGNISIQYTSWFFHWFHCFWVLQNRWCLRENNSWTMYLHSLCQEKKLSFQPTKYCPQENKDIYQLVHKSEYILQPPHSSSRWCAMDWPNTSKLKWRLVLPSLVITSVDQVWKTIIENETLCNKLTMPWWVIYWSYRYLHQTSPFPLFYES